MGEQNYKAFWDEALNEIENEYKSQNNEQEFLLWYNLEYIEDTISEITVEVPSAFMWAQMLSRGNIKKIEDKILELSGKKVVLKNVIKTKSEPEILETSKKTEIKEKIIVKNVEKKEIKPHPQLNEDFTFENFIPGENSDFAYNACLAAAKNPGTAYNPILIYGGVGLGKTHLMQSVGNAIYKENPDKKICFISSADFTTEFTTALGKDSSTKEKFKTKYRNLDVLLLDDIHDLKGKEATQEEFFHTFNALYEKKKQIIFTCDRPVNEMQGFSDRLKNRFSRGLNIDLQPPNFEIRKAILIRKLELSGKYLRDEVLDLIAKNIQSNVRDLESSLMAVAGYQEFLDGKEITLEKVTELLTGSTTSTSEISIEKIQRVVANYYGLTVADLKGKKRDAKIANSRHVAIYIAREITGASFPYLGIEFGNRDHSTIMNSHTKIADLVKIDSTYQSTIQMLIRQCNE